MSVYGKSGVGITTFTVKGFDLYDVKKTLLIFLFH
jgi:hypothetical protein